jgi:shikimate kinase
MKDKVLIIGDAGAGKSRMAQRLAIAIGYKVIDEITCIEELKKMAEAITNNK